MKKYILSMSLVLLAGTPAFAGGVHCKSCPAENDKCIEINCTHVTKNSQAKCTNESVINELLKPAVKTAGGACCSWLPNAAGCFKGC